MAITLADIKRGRDDRPPRLVVYSAPKVGKSTFAACAPDPIFLQTEEGLDAIDVARIDLLGASLEDFMGGLQALATEEHEFKTVVLDSADWLEPIIWQACCDEAQVDSIEKVGGGYGKGYLEADRKWREVLQALDYLRNEKNMCCVIICHEQTVKVQPPDGEAYDVAGLKLHKRASALLHEWADIIGYARVRVALKAEDSGFGKTRKRAVQVGDEHQLIVANNPAYVTGNRYGITDTLPLDWQAFADALREARS